MSAYRPVSDMLGGLLLVGWLLCACGRQLPEPAAGTASPITPGPATPTEMPQTSPGEAPTLPTPQDQPATPLPVATPGAPSGGQETKLPPMRQVFPAPLPTLEPGAVAAEIPAALLDAILADLVARASAARSSIEVVRAEAVVWSDGSLGCPQPGMMYTQALVDGYRVVLRALGREFDYHASQSGYFVLCEGRPLDPSGTPGPSTDR